MDDVSDRRAIRKAEREAKIKAERSSATLAWIMSTKQGREWIHDLLESCHIGTTPFARDPHLTSYLCGEQNIGIKLWSAVQMSCPDLYIQMMEKHMSDQSSTTTDTAGVTRGADGTIQEPVLNQNSSQEQSSTLTEKNGTTPADTKTNDGKTDDNASLLNKKEDDKPTGAPEKYEDFKVPDGLKANPEKMATASALFKELNLSQDGAQKLVDLYAKELTEAAEAPVNAWMEMRKGWQKEVMNHPELGGKIKEVKATIGKAIDTLGPKLAPAFREAMDLTGAGDHPAFVEAFFKFAQQMTEGRHVSGTGPSVHGQRAPGNAAATGAAALYPNLPSAGR